MGGAHSRNKGHGYEREIANKLKDLFPKAKRKLEYQASDIDGRDIEYTGRLAIQCKRYKKYAPIGKINEITAEDMINLLVTKGDREPDMVVLKLDDFLEILKNPQTIF